MLFRDVAVIGLIQWLYS